MGKSVIIQKVNKSVNSRKSNTQMAGKLIFSLNRYVPVEEILSGNSIQYEMEFQDLKISVNGETLIDLSATILGKSPLVEITLGSRVDSPISKMEVIVAPIPTVLSTQENQNQKSIMTNELPSQSEIGSNSSTPVVGRNKMKNYLRRARKRNLKARKTVEFEALEKTDFEANQEFVAPSTYPLLAQRREVVDTRVRSSIHLLDYYTERLKQERIERSPAIGHMPPTEGYDPSTLLEDIQPLEAAGDELSGESRLKSVQVDSSLI
ncbi:hypothetical protein KFK09_001722 [Dendrobium nobile]|uniref:Uncharacterized protein n=1 Tax=Dendrobium nobile TaxID=94219 RepID=A0A8T3CBP0_DENNO|nr:hypothetical protein KFK09_001722 [Dendrobium nobile]